MKIELLENLTLEEHRKLESMKKNYFDESCISPSEKTWEIYKKNPLSMIVLGNPETREIMGSISLLPVTESAFEEILTGKYLEETLSPEQILIYDEPGEYRIYLHSIVVGKNYLNTNIFRKLFFYASKLFFSLAAKGIFIAEMAGEAVTEEGAKLCENILQMEMICYLEDKKCKIYKSKRSVMEKWLKAGKVGV